MASSIKGQTHVQFYQGPDVDGSLLNAIPGAAAQSMMDRATLAAAVLWILMAVLVWLVANCTGPPW